MCREILNSWEDYRSAVGRVLALATRSIRIYDEDAGQLKLDSATHLESMQQLLQRKQPDSLQIALRDAALFREDLPRLRALLQTYGHLIAIQQTPEHLANLRDSLLIVDDRHALVRFDRDHPRSKLLIDDPEEVQQSLTRFQEIFREGGDPILLSPLGL